MARTFAIGTVPPAMDWHLLRSSYFDASGNPGAVEAVEPVTLERAKQHLKAEDTSEDDDLIEGWITATREAAESATNRALVASRWELHRSCFPVGTDPIEIPIGGVDDEGIVSIAYVDGNGDAAFVQGFRLVRRTATRSTVEPPTVWPTGTRVVITFDAGAEGATKRHTAGMLLMLGFLAEHRSEDAEIPQAVAACWNERVW